MFNGWTAAKKKERSLHLKPLLLREKKIKKDLPKHVQNAKYIDMYIKYLLQDIGELYTLFH